jgi:hypothetical protein
MMPRAAKPTRVIVTNFLLLSIFAPFFPLRADNVPAEGRVPMPDKSASECVLAQEQRESSCS